MEIKFGPAGLGSVKTAEAVLEDYHKKGLRACEIAFTYGAYIKNKEDAIRIGKKAKELDISLSIHAPYFVNLNSIDREKREATKKRILDCCEIGELLAAETVVFHPGYYSKDREESYNVIKEGVLELMKEIKNKGWKIKIAPETMGKVNVFGSIEEISKLVRETGCSFCIDFAHILARDKAVDYKKVKVNRKTAVILGNEVGGVSKLLLKLADIIAEIPLKGKKESLNVSVAAGISLRYSS